MKTIDSSIELITKEFAEKALLRNEKNRPVAKLVVSKYAEAIKRGEWKLNGEPIIFDVDGTLVDGQHRLMAVSMTGLPIRSVVVRGVDLGSFNTINNGRSRTASDVLSISGKKNSAVVAAAARQIIRMSHGIKAPNWLPMRES